MKSEPDKKEAQYMHSYSHERVKTLDFDSNMPKSETKQYFAVLRCCFVNLPFLYLNNRNMWTGETNTARSNRGDRRGNSYKQKEFVLSSECDP